jgi:DNA-binding MarR family transcriptional regulator
MSRRTPGADALTDLILELFRVNGNLLAEGDRIAGEFGQSSARWQVLGALEDEVRTVPGIARAMGLTRQSVQRTVDVLQGEGIVEYIHNPAHRRSRLVGLTDRGRAVYDQILNRQTEWANDLTAALPADENDLRKGLEVLHGLRAVLEQPKSPAGHINGPPDEKNISIEERR